jgi:hypothetical protein
MISDRDILSPLGHNSRNDVKASESTLSERSMIREIGLSELVKKGIAKERFGAKVIIEGVEPKQPAR